MNAPSPVLPWVAAVAFAVGAVLAFGILLNTSHHAYCQTHYCDRTP